MAAADRRDADLILALDQGTTGTTALLVDRESRVLALRTVDFPSRFPSPGLVEQDPEEIWASVAAAVSAVLEGVAPRRLAAIGLTNQRETCLLWETATGRAAHPAIVWQDRRTAPRCAELREAGREEGIARKTGLLLDPYFTATKAEWLLSSVSGAREAAAGGRLRLGTVDAWLAERLTGEHATDPSNASRTLLFDLHRLTWDEELLELFGVPPACLPRVVDSSGVLGLTRDLGFLPAGIPVAGIAGDQQAALFGQACFSPGMAKCTYGTGAFVLLQIGETPQLSAHRLLTTVAWRMDGRATYALEGSAFVAGAAVQWLRDGLGFIATAAEVEALALSVPDSGGVVFVPALTGLGAPWWRSEARGVLSGLTRGTTRAHVARAVLDGVILQVADILDAMTRDAGRELAELRVDGGAARNDLLMQLQADVLGVPLVRPAALETTVLGAAYLAGLGAGLWQSEEDVRAAWREDRRFARQADEADVAARRRAYRRALETA